MSGRTGIGGRARRGSGLLEALIDAGFAVGPPRPRTWRELLAATVVCDEVAPQLAQDAPLDWLCDWGGDAGGETQAADVAGHRMG